MNDAPAFVQVATFPRLEQAELAEALLHQEGIEADVPDRGIVGANPLLIGAVGYLRLLVPTASAEAAVDVLRAAGLIGDEGAGVTEGEEEEALAADPADESVRAFLEKGSRPS